MPWERLNAWVPPDDIARGWTLIGAAVRRRREVLAISQRELARRSGVDQALISRLENGKLRAFRWSRFAQIVDAMDGLDFGTPAVRHWIGLDQRAATLRGEIPSRSVEPRWPGAPPMQPSDITQGD